MNLLHLNVEGFRDIQCKTKHINQKVIPINTQEVHGIMLLKNNDSNCKRNLNLLICILHIK